MISKYGIFCEVVKQQSFTKAANSLGYTQGAVSQAIKSLETELGTTLIERVRGNISLTSDGQRFYPYIKQIVSAETRLFKERERFANLEKAEIKMGAFSSICRVVLPPLMKGFEEKYPNVSFTVRQGEYSDTRKWVLNGDVDFAFIILTESDGLSSYRLFDDEICAIFRSDHPLAKKGVIDLQDLVNEPFILIDEQPGENTLFRAFMAAEIHPEIKYSGYDEYSIYAMVKQGLGVSAAYRLCLVGFEDGLVIKKIKGSPSRQICIVWKDWNSVPYAARNFIEFIKSNSQLYDVYSC